MTDKPASLIQDLEAIQQSLDKIARSKPNIPTLEEIVGFRPPTAVNPSNPFLSSSSLTNLLKIRNEAETQSAEELAAIEPAKVISELMHDNEDLADPQEAKPATPDPEEIMSQMETMFESWIENSVAQYMSLFESELRNRLQQDFRSLIQKWYSENDLPIPDKFINRTDIDTSEDSGPESEHSA